MVIAIVDDDWGMLELTAIYLKRSGYTVFSFSDSEECWEWIADPSNICPDVLISDLMMPYFDGRELISKIRSETHCSHIPIILISSAENIGNNDDLWDLFLPKPFQREELLKSIKRVVNIRNS